VVNKVKCLFKMTRKFLLFLNIVNHRSYKFLRPNKLAIPFKCRTNPSIKIPPLLINALKKIYENLCPALNKWIIVVWDWLTKDWLWCFYWRKVCIRRSSLIMYLFRYSYQTSIDDISRTSPSRALDLASN